MPVVEGIDHVHLEVRDRDAAADWYERVLGLRRDARLARWAEDPKGPLVLATESGTPVLSLFAREAKPISRDATIAFRVSGKQFRHFLEQLPKVRLPHHSGRMLSEADVVDHDLSWSIYFLDPDENRIEVTTYDYDFVASRDRSKDS